MVTIRKYLLPRIHNLKDNVHIANLTVKVYLLSKGPFNYLMFDISFILFCCICGFQKRKY